MDTPLWFIAVVSLCIATLLRSLFSLLSSPTSAAAGKTLPPGPTTVPVIGSFLWLRKSFSDLEPLLRRLHARHGPLVTLRIGSRPAVFVRTHFLAHRALVQNGAAFSDRPRSPPAAKILNSDQHNIISAPYGPNWRLLRRNLTAEILHPARIRSYSRARRWVLDILVKRLLDSNKNPDSGLVKVVDHFQYAMFSLLVFMCFGDKLGENQIKEVERVQRELLLSLGRFNVLNFWPRLGRFVFHRRWNELIQLRRNQEDVLIPLIKSRLEVVKQQGGKGEGRSDGEVVMAYVDTLVDLELPEEGKRKLDIGEMVSLCSEFLNAGTDTTSTALQWIMANLVKYPRVQAKLYEEIRGAVGPPPVVGGIDKPDGEKKEEEIAVVIKEEDLQKMKYLKAVVLEGLRRHPPGHFVLPHAVSEEVELGGYVVPKNASVNFMVAEMGWDPKVWDEPMEFKPERFLVGDGGGDGNGSDLFDISGSREIKMMPFGAGRRICPGSGLALMHLEYFVANLIWYFEWTAAGNGNDVDLSEKQEFTVVMKNPLRAHISPRVKS